MDGEQMRDARVRAQLTQEQLAEKLGTTLRTVGTWERAKVPANRVALVRSVLAEQFRTDGPHLTAASDMELLSELARRLGRVERERGAEHGTHAPATKIPETEPGQESVRKIASSAVQEKARRRARAVSPEPEMRNRENE